MSPSSALNGYGISISRICGPEHVSRWKACYMHPSGEIHRSIRSISRSLCETCRRSGSLNQNNVLTLQIGETQSRRLEQARNTSNTAPRSELHVFPPEIKPADLCRHRAKTINMSTGRPCAPHLAVPYRSGFVFSAAVRGVLLIDCSSVVVQRLHQLLLHAINIILRGLAAEAK